MARAVTGKAVARGVPALGVFTVAFGVAVAPPLHAASRSMRRKSSASGHRRCRGR
jgi:hypothetical protein